ncbi:MAG: hypothetical protein GY822_31510 [Deltaproteobacteria bacterium]|nr:hypothetical protein [Deltaproteobacteria bacterium]
MLRTHKTGSEIAASAQETFFKSGQDLPHFADLTRFQTGSAVLEPLFKHPVFRKPFGKLEKNAAISNKLMAKCTMRRIFSLLFVCTISIGCNDGVSPQVSNLSYDGQASDVSTLLLFTLEFADPNGDLGDGRMETFINNRASELPPLALQPLFLREDISLTATQGLLPFEVELSLGSDPSTWPDEGTGFEFGVRLEDEEGHFSDVCTLKLTFSEVS